MNLHVIPPDQDDPDGFTRNQARLDYIFAPVSTCSNQSYITTSKNVKLSDHLPLTTTVTVSLQNIPPSKLTKERVIKKGIKLKDIEQILLDPLWPTKPFIYIAQNRGLTSLSRVQ